MAKRTVKSSKSTTTRERATRRANDGPPSRVTLRLVYGPPPPTHEGRPAVFGIQDKHQDVHPGRAGTGGKAVFDADVEVAGEPSAGPPRFTGPFAQGPPASRFLYLSYRHAAGAQGWIFRVKIPLAAIEWAQIERARATGRVIQADVTGRKPHATEPVVWQLVPR